MDAQRCLLVILIATTYSTAHNLDRLHVNRNGLFEGGDGTARIFHGTSFMNKNGPNMIVVPDEQMEIASKSWGFTIARVGFEWHLLEPKQGVYNYTYLKQMEDIVERFAEHGIYSILDMHQDCWSDLYCAHGIPSFYAHPYPVWTYMKDGLYAFPEPIAKPQYDPNAKGDYPEISNCGTYNNKDPIGWAGCYTTFAMGAAAQRLYENEDHYLERFGDMWTLIAKTFANQTGVIAYELLNEPWVGDPYAHPLLWDAGVADKKNIDGMNKYLHKRIREIDNITIIFFEPATGANLNFGPVGFETGPGGPEYNDRQAMSYHEYCNGMAATACKIYLDTMTTIRVKDVKRLGCGALLTEMGAFGSVVGASASSIISATEMQKNMDDNLQGWVFWYAVPSNTQDLPTVRLLTRTYPRKTAGDPKAIKFDNSTGDFTFTFAPRFNNQTTGEVVLVDIYANVGMFYTKGLNCTISPSQPSISCGLAAAENTVLVKWTGDSQIILNEESDDITVVIKNQ